MQTGSILRRGVAALLGLALCGACHGGGLSVTPLRVDFSAARGVGAITITNTSRETVTFEADAVPWPHDASGQSERDIVINPPVTTLAPGARRTLRIGLVKRLGSEQERSYRVYVTELPSARSADATGLGVRLRIGIPVFVAADTPREQPMQWAVQRDGGTLRITATNAGNVHQRVGALSLEQGRKHYRATQTSTYVLAGRSTVFQVDGIDARAGEELVLRVQTGETQVRVPVVVP